MLESRLGAAEEEIASLKKKKKHSGNSSILPSMDLNRIKPNQSLRNKTDKKTGGQKGHKGHTLKMSDKVDLEVS